MRRACGWFVLPVTVLASGNVPPSRFPSVAVFLAMEAVNSRSSFSYPSKICGREGETG
jgi:hypothetical protein